MKPGELLNIEIPTEATHRYDCQCGATLFFRIDQEGGQPEQFGTCYCDHIVPGSGLKMMNQGAITSPHYPPQSRIKRKGGVVE